MQFTSTLVAVICLTLSAVIMAAPQGFIGQEKCTITGTYDCGLNNSIIVCNTSGKWVTVAYCGSDQHCALTGGSPHCI